MIKNSNLTLEGHCSQRQDGPASVTAIHEFQRDYGHSSHCTQRTENFMVCQIVFFVARKFAPHALPISSAGCHLSSRAPHNQVL